MGDELSKNPYPSTVTGSAPSENPAPVNEGGDPWVDAPQENHEDSPAETGEVPTYGDSTNLKTDRVFKAGEPDMNAVADTTYTAQGNQYPQSQASKENEARALRAEAGRLQAEADQAKARADAFEASIKVDD